MGHRIITTGTLAALTFLCGAHESARAQCYQQLWAPDGETDDMFGHVVAAQGDVVVVTASQHQDQTGAAYVYRRQQGQWVLETKLQPGDSEPWQEFAGPALYGDLLLVGCRRADGGGRENSGAAYVFRWDGSDWLEEAKLLPSDPAEEDIFGFDTAAGEDFVAIGAFQDDDAGPDSGAVYLFRKEAGTWVQEAKLLPSVGDGKQAFGHGIAIAGDRVFIGAPQRDRSDTGTVYVFRYEGATWVEEARLLASDGSIGDQFGNELGVDGDRLLVGARADDGWRGSAYVFGWDGSSWVEEAKITPDDSGGWFGMDVAIRGDDLAIGAIFNASSGSTYHFRHDGSRWNQVAKYHDPDLPGGSRHGHSVALADDFLVAGAPMRGSSDIGVGPGTAYVYATCDWTWQNYADGWPGTLGIPELTADTDLPPLLTIDVGNSFGTPTAGFLIVGLAKAQIPSPWGGELCVLPAAPVWPFLLPIRGMTLVTELPDLFADELFLQVLELDLGASQGVSFTRGLQIRF